MAVAAKNVIDSFREAIQDLLVPELKALRVSLDLVRTEMHLSLEGLHSEMRLSQESLRSEMRFRDEKMQDSVRHLSEKLDFAIDIRERLAALEARQMKQ